MSSEDCSEYNEENEGFFWGGDGSSSRIWRPGHGDEPSPPLSPPTYAGSEMRAVHGGGAAR